MVVATENRIISGVIWKQILIFFFPILLGTFFQQLYNTFDAVIVGQFVGTAALAAVGGATGNLVNIVVNLFVGIASGATVIIAQSVGASEVDKVRKTVHTAVALSLCGGLAFTVFGALIARPALAAMGTPDDVIDFAVTYLTVYFFGAIPSFFYNVGAGILRAVGDTKRPLYFLMVACVTNIVLDVVLVAFLKMGVFGAALATVVSQWVSAVLIFIVLTHTTRIYHMEPSMIRFSSDALKAVLKIGIPVALQSNMFAMSNVIVQSCINSFGTDTMAAWTSFAKVDGFFWMISSAYGISITTFAGQNFGAGRYDRIRKSVRVCLGMFSVTAICMSVLMVSCAGVFLRMFTQDADVLAIGTQLIYHMMPFYITYVCIEILSGAICGCGQSLIPMIMTGCGICLMRIIWIFAVVPLHRDILTVAASYPISWTLTSLCFVVMRGKFLPKESKTSCPNNS